MSIDFLQVIYLAVVLSVPAVVFEEGESLKQ